MDNSSQSPAKAVGFPAETGVQSSMVLLTSGPSFTARGGPVMVNLSGNRNPARPLRPTSTGGKRFGILQGLQPGPTAKIKKKHRKKGRSRKNPDVPEVVTTPGLEVPCVSGSDRAQDSTMDMSVSTSGATIGSLVCSKKGLGPLHNTPRSVDRDGVVSDFREHGRSQGMMRRTTGRFEDYNLKNAELGLEMWKARGKHDTKVSRNGAEKEREGIGETTSKGLNLTFPLLTGLVSKMTVKETS